MNYNDQEKIMGMVKNLATTLGIPIVTSSQEDLKKSIKTVSNRLSDKFMIHSGDSILDLLKKHINGDITNINNEECSCNCESCEEQEREFNVRYRTMNVLKDETVEFFDGPVTGRVIVGRITCATYPINNDKTKFRVGFSYCSPRDNFDRKLGQENALEDLELNGLTFYRNEDDEVYEILKEVAVNVAKERHISWMRKIDSSDIF